MRVHRRALTLFALTILLSISISACSSTRGSGEDADWVAAYDTIGDTLVVRTLSGSVWRGPAQLVPTVSIGMLSGPDEYIFGQIVSLARGDDGTIYDGGLNVLSDGRVVLRDPGNARIQVFSPEGEALDTWRLRGGFFTSSRMVVDQDDRSHVLMLLDAEASVRDWERALLQILSDGSHGDTLPFPDTGYEPPRIEATSTNEAGEIAGIARNGVPFAPDERTVLSPMGYFIHGVSTEYALTLLRSGEPHLRIERAFTPVIVTAGERAEEEARATRNMRGMDPNWRWNGPPIPDVKPPFDGLFAGEDGTIWVQVPQPGVHGEDPDYDPADPDDLPDEWTEPIVFDVFDAEGHYLGEVHTPEGFSRYPEPVFTRDWVLATTRDEFDVQSVVMFKVELPGGRIPSEVEAEGPAR
jgi:predicted small secreted protein